MTNIEETIEQIKREKRKIENNFDTYKNENLRIFKRKIENILEDYRLLNGRTEQVIEDTINSLKGVISLNEDILNGAINRNIQALNKKNAGDIVNLNEQINTLDEVISHVKKYIDTHIDSTEIGYGLIKELGIIENEEARYEVNRTTVNEMERLKDELIRDTTKIFTTITEHNVTLNNIDKANEIENTPELIVIQTSDGKNYTVEKLGEMLSLRTWKPEDSFNADQFLYGAEADLLHNNLKVEEPIIGENLSQNEQISANRQAFK